MSRCDNCDPSFGCFATGSGCQKEAHTVLLLTTEVDRLRMRVEELLQTVARLTNEIPYEEELDGWMKQRAAMIAEVGSLRAALAEAHRQGFRSIY